MQTDKVSLYIDTIDITKFLWCLPSLDSLKNKTVYIKNSPNNTEIIEVLNYSWTLVDSMPEVDNLWYCKLPAIPRSPSLRKNNVYISNNLYYIKDSLSWKFYSSIIKKVKERMLYIEVYEGIPLVIENTAKVIAYVNKNNDIMINRKYLSKKSNHLFERYLEGNIDIIKCSDNFILWRI